MVSFAWITECIYAATEGEERFVDVCTFKKPFSPVFCCARTLAPSQVDDAECCHCMWFVDVGIPVLLCNVDLKNCMGSRRSGICLCWGHRPTGVSLHDHIHNFLYRFRAMARQSGHRYCFVCIFSQGQAALCAARNKQIANGFVVDFEERKR